MSEWEGMMRQLEQRQTKIILGVAVLVAVLAIIFVPNLIGDKQAEYDPETFESISQLEDAAQAAGLPCANPDRQGSLGVSKATSYCGDKVTLLLFDGMLDKSRMILEMFSQPSMNDAIVMEGTNWFINAPRDMLEEAQPYLRGRIRTE
jgi:hypothetical protein